MGVSLSEELAKLTSYILLAKQLNSETSTRRGLVMQLKILDGHCSF